MVAVTTTPYTYFEPRSSQTNSSPVVGPGTESEVYRNTYTGLGSIDIDGCGARRPSVYYTVKLNCLSALAVT